MARFSLLLPAVLLLASPLFAWQKSVAVDSVAPRNLHEAFKKGTFGGYFRNYFMVTDNASGLSDYYAWAAGGNLRFQSAPLHGFSMGIGGVFNFNLASSDLSAKDSITGAVNRYEIGLFDVENPSNRNNLDRMEEFWLRYQVRKTRITLGKQGIQTPFINDQDGRMRPTAVSGVWLESQISKHTRIEGGWIWKISPRSTVRWYQIGESIGVYPRGLNPDGTASGYANQLNSNGIGMLGMTRQAGKYVKVQVWNQFVDNIFNTTYLRIDSRLPIKPGHFLLGGVQYTHQEALNHGGHEDQTKSYFKQGSRSNTISAQTGYQIRQWQALAAYTRITSEGRFLSPREWGREPFYTFMARERVEGSGDVHAVTGRVIWQPARLRFELAYGHFYLPDVKTVALNKYAFPAYQQFNADLRYTFKGRLEGLRMQLLYVWKGRIGDVYGNQKLIINRVNMSHVNLIFNYVY